MKLAIMQPYLFPYLGYFQLIHAVDEFVIYDDVNFIKKGWINRNNILVNGEKKRFTIPIESASQNKKILELSRTNDLKADKKFLNQIEISYHKAPYFEQVSSLLLSIFSQEDRRLPQFIKGHFDILFNYLDFNKTITYASALNLENSFKGEQRIIEICKRKGASMYINSNGGQDMYKKKNFIQESIELRFIQSKPIIYSQFKAEFVPNMSIIDVLMHNSPKEVKTFFNEYTLI